MTKESKERILFLLGQYVEGKISFEEEKLLAQLLNEENDIKECEQIVEELMFAESELADYDREKWQPVVSRILERQVSTNNPQVRVRKIIHWSRWVAAAVLVILIGSGVYFYFTSTKNSRHQDEKTNIAIDIKPGTNVPQLILADGRSVNLDSALSGALATEGNVKITRLSNGEIVYGADIKPSEVKYNTIINPRGSKVQALTLIDGTKVWLDASSSITYPNAFVGKNRRVEIKGQAYFEVAHNANMPFKVKKALSDEEIEVLGTHFNVMAHDDENEIKVTLLEGSVSVSKRNSKVLIKPGEQAVIKNVSLSVNHSADLEQAMAWKNGLLRFNRTDVQSAMREISRWYDVQIEYQGNVQGFFNGSISRTENVSKVLQMLSMTGEVKFEIADKKIIVKP